MGATASCLEPAVFPASSEIFLSGLSLPGLGVSSTELNDGPDDEAGGLAADGHHVHDDLDQATRFLVVPGKQG